MHPIPQPLGLRNEQVLATESLKERARRPCSHRDRRAHPRRAREAVASLASSRVIRSLLGFSALVILSACATAAAPAREPLGEVVLANTPVAAVVNEYFHYRKLAVVARDAEILWARFPALRNGEDMPTGINTEGWHAMRSDAARSLSDVIYELDRYDRIRMREVNDQLVVRVHGLERYIEADFSNGTAGAFILDLYLRRDQGSWRVVRTDEMTLAESHERP